ncbi:MAG: thiamine diphosphokinase [Tissierellia bacterium]|nr:thiamine diphosphokinase [Tissierellia bacterium]
MKKAILIGGGEVDFKISEPISEYFIICADRGVDNAIHLGLKPELVIGDMDSISDCNLLEIRRSNIHIIEYNPEKDKTDMELSLDYLASNGYKDIIVLGATGTRLDHTLSNIFCLKKYKEMGIYVRIIDGHNIIQYLDDHLSFDKDDYKYSILALSNDGIEVSLRGFYYDLDRHKIDFGSSLGISNYIYNDKADILVHRGYGLLIKSKD